VSLAVWHFLLLKFFVAAHFGASSLLLGRALGTPNSDDNSVWSDNAYPSAPAWWGLLRQAGKGSTQRQSIQSAALLA